MNCIQCGAELAEHALFCKKCGTKVEKDNCNQINNSGKQFEELSLKLRKISDEMIAEYVSAMKRFELESEKVVLRSKQEIQELKEILKKRDNELQELKNKLDTCERELKKAKEQLLNFKSKKEIQENRIEKIDAEEPMFCYTCGELITDDMLYCGNCGMKIR